MAEQTSNSSGDERAKRIAELKRKMQESAKRAKAAQGGEEPSPASAEASSAVKPVEAAPKPVAAEAAVETAVASPPESKSAAKPAASKPSVNGSSPQPKPEPEGPSKANINRREFFTYAWGGALGLLALEGLGLSMAFMYPRFRAGEFGGEIHIGPESALPDSSAAPQIDTAGKFWLVTTQEDETKALYVVCTHLGCLYKWETTTGRFECPCHGSKFTHDGYYIEGPAPRSLDYFAVNDVDGEIVVDTGSKTLGDPAGESPANASAA